MMYNRSCLHKHRVHLNLWIKPAACSTASLKARNWVHIA
jgi:hypothetical protein